MIVVFLGVDCGNDLLINLPWWLGISYHRRDAILLNISRSPALEESFVGGCTKIASSLEGCSTPSGAGFHVLGSLACLGMVLVLASIRQIIQFLKLQQSASLNSDRSGFIVWRIINGFMRAQSLGTFWNATKPVAASCSRNSKQFSFPGSHRLPRTAFYY